MSDARFVYTESHRADAEMHRENKRRRMPTATRSDGIRETL